MAVTPHPSVKRVMIDRANATMLITISITSFIVVFSLISIRALVSQMAYQNRVITAKSTALKQLQTNNNNVDSLVASYKSFAEEKINVINGDPKGNGPRDGDNPKIVLDALPSKYDFPGLISTLEKLFSSGGYKLDSIGGSDDEVNQLNASSDNPLPVEIPFPVSLQTNYVGAQNLFTMLEHSIRPIYVNQISITANSSGALTISMSAKTFYQPEKSLKITSKVVK